MDIPKLIFIMKLMKMLNEQRFVSRSYNKNYKKIIIVI